MADYGTVDYMPKGGNYFGKYFNAFDIFHPESSSIYSNIPARDTINGQKISSDLKMGNFATTAHPGKDPLEELSTKIKEGATALELGFTGQGKGSVSQGQTTPGSFSMDERRAIQKLAEQNNMRLSTHASITLTGFSGLTRDQETYGWKFDNTKRVEAEKEAEQTIDFAADTAKGGAIVIHAGEFFRDIVNSPGNFENDEGGFFESYTGQRKKIKEYAERVSKGEESTDEKGKEEFHFQLGKVARADTGEIEKVYRDAPILMKKEEWARISKEVDILNEQITKINNSGLLRDEKERQLEEAKIKSERAISEITSEFEQIYTNEKKEELRNSIYKEGTNEIDVGKNKTVEQINYAEVLKKENFNYGEADKLFHRLRLSQAYGAKKADVESSRASYEEQRKDLEDLREAFEIQKKIEEETPDSEKWKLKKKMMRQRVYDMGLIPEEYQMPTKFLEEQIKQKEDQLRHVETNLLDAQQNLTMIKSQIGSTELAGNLRSIEELGLERSAETISDLGLHAMQKWNVDLEGINSNGIPDRQKLNELARAHGIDFEKKSDMQLKKEVDEHALYVAPENMMPDFGPTGEPAYGGHPQELKEIIMKAREAMAEKLEHPENHDVNMRALGFSKDRLDKKDAEDYARRHIKATFDIGHANTWRKFFHGDKNSNKSEDEQFKEWLHNQVKDLLDQGIIGHAHVTDNFGYADDHISPGEGGEQRGAPIGDFTKLLLDAEKGGHKPVEPWIVEAGHQGVNVLFNAWHNLGHPIYRLGSGISGPSFGFMEQSYLTSSYSSRHFNEAGLGPGQNRQVGWSGAPLI